METFLYKIVILWIFCWLYRKQLQIVASHSNSQSAPIISGQKAELGQFPWHVLLRRDDVSASVCGGSILSDIWILTAAKCIYKHDIIYLTFGTVELFYGGFNTSSVQMFIHPAYSENSLYNDIGLIELSEPLNFDNDIQPIKLVWSEHAGKNFVDSKAYITGFGSTDDDPISESIFLNWAFVKIIANDICASALHLPSIQKTIMCSMGYKDPSQSPCGDNDAGGALVWRNEYNLLEQIGIISYSVDNNCSRYPATYTRISSYLDWIHNITVLNFD